MSSPESNETVHQVGRYGLAGAANTVVGFALIFGLQTLGTRPAIANAAGYLVGFLLSFVLQRAFVFGSTSTSSSDFARFLVAFLLCFAANQVVLLVMLTVGVNAYLAQLAAIAVYVVSMFFVSRNWVFKNRA